MLEIKMLMFFIIGTLIGFGFYLWIIYKKRERNFWKLANAYFSQNLTKKQRVDGFIGFLEIMFSKEAQKEFKQFLKKKGSE